MFAPDSRGGESYGLLAATSQPAMTTPDGARLPAAIQNTGGLKLLVASENADPTLRVILPGHAETDRAREVIFPEHVTARRHGSFEAERLYLFLP